MKKTPNKIRLEPGEAEDFASTRDCLPLANGGWDYAVVLNYLTGKKIFALLRKLN
jgi:hypothetical protein